MVWSLGEADKQLLQEDLATAEVSMVSRDERHHRLHIQARLVEPDGALAKGYLGQLREYEPDAIGITRASNQIFKNACTKFQNPPAGARVKEVFLEDTYKHFCTTVEAISVDSAAPEVVSAGDMRSGSAAFCKNCRYVLRDAAHSVRRVPQRLFKCDKVQSGNTIANSKFKNSMYCLKKTGEAQGQCY